MQGCITLPDYFSYHGCILHQSLFQYCIDLHASSRSYRLKDIQQNQYTGIYLINVSFPIYMYTFCTIFIYKTYRKPIIITSSKIASTCMIESVSNNLNKMHTNDTNNNICRHTFPIKILKIVKTYIHDDVYYYLTSSEIASAPVKRSYRCSGNPFSGIHQSYIHWTAMI